MSTIQGLDPFLAKLKSVEQLQTKMVAPMNRGVDILYGNLSIPPSKARGAFTRTATPGQKRWYWSAVSRGAIQHSDSSGYIRSGKTEKGWKKRVRKFGNGLQGIVGTDRVPPTEFVQGARQQPFHAISQYPTPEKALAKSEPQIKREFEIAFRKAIEG